ncbi:acyl-CoA N-acyltransferase [Mycena rebaudengoi]|nr:acyl-CoA N-acyltransferase [Mycena rebaudengoi]
MPATHTIPIPAVPPSGIVLKNGVELRSEDDFMPSATDTPHSRKRKRSSQQQGDSDDGSPTPVSAEENGVERTMVISEEDYDFEHHKQITAKRNFDKRRGNPRPEILKPPLSESANGAGSSAASSALKIPGVRNPTIRSHGRVLDIMAGGLNRSEKMSTLFVCGFCFKYMGDATSYERHRLNCNVVCPPGRRIYQRGAHTIWEVDGAVQKTLFFDCDNFLFYLLTDATTKTDQVLGFFSKEKVSYDDYNLACIITLPPYQHKGYGMLMIEFSYELSRRAGKVGTPERPLSDLGLRSYLAYWVATIIRFLRRVLDFMPEGSNEIVKRRNTSQFRSPSRELEDEGTPSVVNGHGNVSATPSNGISKRKKRTKGWAGEVAEALGSVQPGDQDFVDAFREEVYKRKPNGGVEGELVIRCTLADIARATNLRPEDAALALNEIGLLAMRLSSEDPKQLRKNLEAEKEAKVMGREPPVSHKFIHITRAMVEHVAEDRQVKPPCLQPDYWVKVE